MKKFTEIGKHHNSFLAKSAMNQKILVIVPHEDDEINVAGSVMYMYAQKERKYTVCSQQMEITHLQQQRGCEKLKNLCTHWA